MDPGRHPGSLYYGMRADPTALRGRGMAWHRVGHLVAANGHGFREHLRAARIISHRRKCDF